MPHPTSGSAEQTPKDPLTRVEVLTRLDLKDMNDLCDATTLAIENGGGFGWVEVPERDVMERFWQGVVAMPLRHLIVARLDDVICGTAQLILPPPNNEAQSHAVQLASVFVAPWARGYGLARKLIERAEERGLKDGYKVVNLDMRATQQAAINLCESMGYQQCGLNPHYAEINGEAIRGYYYYKSLKNEVHYT